MKPYTLKQFIEYCHMIDCLNSTAPPHTITKKKYSLTKRKAIQKRITELQTDERGVPFEVTKQPLVSKSVTDTNGIMRLIVDYIHYVYPKSKSFRRISSEGKWRQGIGYIPSSNKGLSDGEGIVNGKFLSLELKIGKDTIRESQLKRKREIENDGGIYYLCKWIDFETFQTEMQNLIPIE
jgi:hypothetical protein